MAAEPAALGAYAAYIDEVRRSQPYNLTKEVERALTVRGPFAGEDQVTEFYGRGLHSFSFPLNLSALCPFPFNLSLHCPHMTQINPWMCPLRAYVLKFSSNVRDVFPKVLKLSSEVACRPLFYGNELSRLRFTEADGNEVNMEVLLSKMNNSKAGAQLEQLQDTFMC